MNHDMVWYGRIRENVFCVLKRNTRRELLFRSAVVPFIYLPLFMICHVENHQTQCFQVDCGHLYHCGLKYLESTSHLRNFWSSSLGIPHQNCFCMMHAQIIPGIDLVRISATLSCLVISSPLTSSMSSPRFQNHR